jgi:hypothetical protein
MKSQISISGQAVSRRRAANQVKPFHRQKTDSHTRRPGIVSGRYDDPVTVKRLGKTDPLAAGPLTLGNFAVLRGYGPVSFGAR